MIYLDTSYIIKCYVNEPGTGAVLDLLEQTAGRATAAHARTEFWSGIHRHFREGHLTRKQAAEIWRQFGRDEKDGLWQWLPLNDEVVRRSCVVFEALGDSIFLRSADSLHLACAAANGFAEIYSSDRHLLKAAAFFGVTAVNVISPSTR
ncbi:MAG: type II toxin-antitoxin system VapC family toxin [Verrucomicrobiota bacterium]|nr:type II toxin-antitoxin system VapC family toxin [Verrucomicrobiota bacterium]